MFKDKKILLTAFSVIEGSESLAIYKYLLKRGATDISTLYWGGSAVAEGIPSSVKAIEITDRRDVKDIDLSQYDIIFRHTTIRPDWLPYGDKVTSATNLFLKECSARVVAVTGTKGKGTTSTLIYKMLQAAGKSVYLVGNIGRPAIELVDEIDSSDIVVFEISSFQAWDLNYSPAIAVMLMMASDHQDVHDSIEEYIQAKAQLLAHQTNDDVVIYHPTNEMTAKAVSRAASRKIPYMTKNGSAHVVNGAVVVGSETIINTADVGLRGAHNLENICAAITAVWQLTQDVEAIRSVCQEFTGLEHRLELVAKKHGVLYYNDSFAAAQPAAIAATKAFDEPKIMIYGGSDKGATYDELAETAASTNLKLALLIGVTANKIALALNKYNVPYEILENVSMEQIVEKASNVAADGEVVVLSPGCASFDMFKNYKDRGNQFRSAVKKLDE